MNAAQQAIPDLQVYEDEPDTLQRKGWRPVQPAQRERGDLLMAQWSLEDA